MAPFVEMAPKNWITAKEAAALCNVTPKTFYRWRQSGKGPHAYEFSRKKIWYDENDVLQWIGSKKR